MSEDKAQITKSKKKIERLFKRLDGIDRKIYLMNEAIDGIKQKLRNLF